MYIPDLFGAYVKGRELAIEKNWQDLKNYEQVEQMRNSNDLQALDLLGKRADFGGNRSMFQNQADASSAAAEVMEYAQPGMVARADMGSMFAQDQRGVYLNNRDLAQQGMNDTFNAQLNRMINAASAQRGENDYLRPAAYEMGGNRGYGAYQTSQANRVTDGNRVNAAGQAVNLSNQAYGNNYAAGQLQGIQTGYAIQNAPLQQKNTMDALGRIIPARDAMQAQIDNGNAGGVSNQQIAGLISLASAGDQGAIWQLAQMGLSPQGVPIQQVQQGQAPQGQAPQGQAPQGQAQPTTALPGGTTPNGMPMQQFKSIGNTVSKSIIPTPAQQTNQQAQQAAQVANTVQQATQPQMYYHPIAGWIEY